MLNKLDDPAVQDIGFLVARVFLALVFLLGAINWFFTGPPSGLLARSGWPAPALLAYIAFAMKLLGSLSVVLGYKVRIGALVLLLFTVITTLGFHIPTSIIPPEPATGYKEIGLIGGLLLVALVGAGKYSLDAKFAAETDA